MANHVCCQRIHRRHRHHITPNIVISMSVCLSVCPITYHISKLHVQNSLNFLVQRTSCTLPFSRNGANGTESERHHYVSTSSTDGSTASEVAVYNCRLVITERRNESKNWMCKKMSRLVCRFCLIDLLYWS